MTREEGLLAAARRTTTRILQLEEVKTIVKSEEALAKAYRRLGDQFRALPDWLQRQLLSLAGMYGKHASVGSQANYSARLVLHQLRGVRHSTETANAVLGSTSAYDFGASMASYRAWYAEMYGHGGRFWDLYRQLL